jgi:glycosyltransferase involved in cell wall biosynthesis
MEKMEGEYFSWLSHDDKYYPTKIEKQVNILSGLIDKNTVIRCSIEAINEKNEKIYYTNYYAHQNAYPLREKSKYYPVIFSQVHGCDLLIPKAAFKTAGNFDEKVFVAQDYEFFYRLFLNFPKYVMNEILVIARYRAQGQGVQKIELREKEYGKLFISIMEQLTDDDITLLAPSKLEFFLEVRDIVADTGYSNVVKYINNRLLINLQIDFKDLVGNKFNGFDLAKYFKKKDIYSNMLVTEKYSDEEFVKQYDGNSESILYNELFYYTSIIHMHLIHCLIHNCHFNLCDLPLITKLKPVILTLHDPYFLGGHCIHHFDCIKWQNHCYDCEYLDKPFAIKHDDTALQFEKKRMIIQNSQISAIVASHWMEEKVKKSPIWEGKKVYYLPFGIDQDLFKLTDIRTAKKKLGIRPDSFTIMFRSTNNPYKGLDIILKALEDISFNSIKPTIITVEEKGLTSHLKEKYNIIEFDWLKDDNKMAGLYQACDIFLIPSRQETFGMMAIEAMSCGKMVLALTGTALPDVINSPECSIAVEEKDFANELQRLTDNPHEIIERGQKSLVYAKIHYNKDIYVNRMIEIYKEVIANHVSDDSAKLILEQLKKHHPTFLNNRVQNEQSRQQIQTYHPLVIKAKNKLMKISAAPVILPVVKPFLKFSYRAVRKLYRIGKKI